MKSACYHSTRAQNVEKPHSDSKTSVALLKKTETHGLIVWSICVVYLGKMMTTFEIQKTSALQTNKQTPAQPPNK